METVCQVSKRQKATQILSKKRKLLTMSACIALRGFSGNDARHHGWQGMFVIDSVPNVSLLYRSNQKDARGYPDWVLACCVDVEVLTSAEAVYMHGH